ncbi:MAG: 2-oxo acid dehydrogenase subunit E2 [Vampirovibrionales bacterium]|jgi:pyruvate/2-oxoglutarate dehydrogenase complex dihydrolipoamide acyltransferase (E2) component|nr:2-oxo acid dehydrogenase subunit E2 [Vampirovibrionales bacterium]
MHVTSPTHTANVYTFTLPDIGEGVAEGEIMAWFAEEGQALQEDQALLEVMTDKVTVEIPAPRAGILLKKYVQVGDVVPVGQALVDIHFGEALHETSPSSTVETKSEPVVASPAPQKTLHPETKAIPAVEPSPQGACELTHAVLAAPATRQLAKRLNVDIHTVVGTGLHGRIRPEDVEDHARRVSVPQGATSSHTSILRQSPLEAKDIPYTGIRKKIGERLLASTQNIPSFAYVDEIRMDKVEALRQELKGMASEAGVKLTPLTFVLKAVTLALQSFPQLNSRLNDAQTVIHQHANIHLGVAVDAPQGLVVPVVSNAEHLHLFEIAKRVQELGMLAKEGKLKPQQMQGGTFTVSSIGSIGGLLGIPIINAPEVAILGVNALRKVAVVNERDEIVVGKVLNLSISADHRVVDGADAARFVNLLKSLLESPAQLLL